jgi:hypothetical protein
VHPKIITRFLLCGFLTVSLSSAQTLEATGSLHGQVQDTEGRPLAGAVVSYMSVAPSVAAGLRATPAPGEKLATGSVVAGADGGFKLSGLPSAQHVLCAAVPSGPYLNPCVWRQGVRTAVTAGSEASAIIVLEKGVYLNVRVNDPKGLLPAVVDGLWTPRKLKVGVTYGSGAFEAAQNTSVDASGRNYQMTIPAGRTVLALAVQHRGYARG